MPTLRVWLACSLLAIWLRSASGGNVGSRPSGLGGNHKFSPGSLLARADDMWEAQENRMPPTSQRDLVWITVEMPQRARADSVFDGRHFVLPIMQNEMTIDMLALYRRFLTPEGIRIPALSQQAKFGPTNLKDRRFREVTLPSPDPGVCFTLPDLRGFDISNMLDAVKQNWGRRIFFSQGLTDQFSIKILRRSSSEAYRPFRGKIVYAVIIAGHEIQIAPSDGPGFVSIYALPHDSYFDGDDRISLLDKLFRPPNWLARAESLASVQSQT